MAHIKIYLRSLSKSDKSSDMMVPNEITYFSLILAVFLPLKITYFDGFLSLIFPGPTYDFIRV